MAISSTSFEPGVSGNPHGRPRKDQSLTSALEGIVDKQELAHQVEGQVNQLIFLHPGREVPIIPTDNPRERSKCNCATPNRHILAVA